MVHKYHKSIEFENMDPKVPTICVNIENNFKKINKIKK